MTKEERNKEIVGQWFKGFWANPWDPGVVEQLASADILLEYSLHAPRRGIKDVKNFISAFRAAARSGHRLGIRSTVFQHAAHLLRKHAVEKRLPE